MSSPSSSSSSLSSFSSTLMSKASREGVSGPDLERLPGDCQCRIAQFLDWGEHFQLRLVCKELLRVCLQAYSWNPELVKRVIGRVRCRLTDEQVRVLMVGLQQSMPGVKVQLRWYFGDALTDASLQHIAAARDVRIEKLYLNFSTKLGTQLTSEALSQLLNSAVHPQFGAIRWLVLGGCKLLKDPCLSVISGLETLETLRLSGCSLITDKGLGSLSSLQLLQSLNLYDCSLITDKGLAHLSSLQSLHTLNLRGCSSITDKGLVALHSMPSLLCVYLNGTKVTQDGRKKR